jgi:hypothetical protein
MSTEILICNEKICPWQHFKSSLQSTPFEYFSNHVVGTCQNCQTCYRYYWPRLLTMLQLSVPVFLKRWSAGGFRRKNTTKIAPHTERMKNTIILVCAKTAFVGWPSTESRRISSSHNFLYFNRYFIKYFKLLYIKNVVMITLTTGVVLQFTCTKFWVQGILRRWSSCALTAYEVARDCRKFEKHWSVLSRTRSTTSPSNDQNNWGVTNTKAPQLGNCEES